MRWTIFLSVLMLVISAACDSRERNSRSGSNASLFDTGVPRGQDGAVSRDGDGGSDENSNPPSFETSCINGSDDDGDFAVDCDDSDCSADAACSEEPARETLCSNGVDDDGDFATDCDDSDCAGNAACLAPSTETSCSNGVDDDGDFATDCDDSDCDFDAACQETDNRTRTCGARPPSVGALSATPMCSAETQTCINGCADQTCFEDCILADTTPPQTIQGQSFDCNACLTYEFFNCAYSAGCDTQLADYYCCASDNGCTTGSCAQSFCAAEATALQTCLSGVTSCNHTQTSGACYN